VEEVEEAPAGDGAERVQDTMPGEHGGGKGESEEGRDREGGEDAFDALEVEILPEELFVFGQGTISGVAFDRGGAEEAAGEEKDESPGKVSEIRHRCDEAGAGFEDAADLRASADLIGEVQVFDDIEGEDEVEGGIFEGEVKNVALRDGVGFIVEVDAPDVVAFGPVAFDEKSFATAKIDDAGVLRCGIKEAFDASDLFDIDGVVCPAFVEMSMIVSAEGVFAAGFWRSMSLGRHAEIRRE